MSWLGLGPASLARRARRGAASPITAGALPALGPLTEGETLSAAVNWGSYSSTAGSIATPTTREMRVNAGAWGAYDGAVVVSAGQSWQLRETVTDTAGNSRAFASGAQTASGIAPAVTASDSLSGRTLTITVDSTTGAPAPSTALTALTLEGEDVLADATGSDPWTYDVPDSESLQTVAWTVTAENFEGTDTASGSETVAANLFAPAAAGAIADLTFAEGQAITPLDVSTDFSGTAPITYALAPSSAALPDGLSLSSEGEITGTPTTTTAQGNIVVRGTNAYGFADTAFGVTIEAASPAFSPADLLTGDPEEVFIDLSKLGTYATDTSGNNAASVGNNIAYYEDESGNGNHGISSSASERFSLRQAANGNYWIERANLANLINFGASPASATWTGVLGFVPDGQDFIAFSDLGDTQPWMGIGQDGNTSGGTTPSSGIAAQTAIYFDNVAYTGGTRDGQFHAAQGSNTLIVEAQTDNGAELWSSLVVGDYNRVGALSTPGDLFGCILWTKKSLTSAEGADLQAWLEARKP